MAIKSDKELKRSIITEAIAAADTRDNRLSGALKETVRTIVDFRRQRNYAPDRKNPIVNSDVRLFWDFIDGKFVANKHSYGRTMWIADVNFNRMNAAKWKKATSELNLDEAVAAATETVSKSILKRSRELVSIHETVDSAKLDRWPIRSEVEGYLHPDRVALQKGLLRDLACSYLQACAYGRDLEELQILFPEYINERHFQNEVELVKSELRKEVFENRYLKYDTMDNVFHWIEVEFGIDVVLDCLIKGQCSQYKWKKPIILDYILDKLVHASITVTEQMLNWADEHIKYALFRYVSGDHITRFLTLAKLAPEMLRSQYLNLDVAHRNCRRELQELINVTELGKETLPLTAIITDLKVRDSILVTGMTAQKLLSQGGSYTDIVITDFEYDMAVVDAKYNRTLYDLHELQALRNHASIAHASQELVNVMRDQLLIPKELVKLVSNSKLEQELTPTP